MGIPLKSLCERVHFFGVSNFDLAPEMKSHPVEKGFAGESPCPQGESTVSECVREVGGVCAEVDDAFVDLEGKDRVERDGWIVFEYNRCWCPAFGTWESEHYLKGDLRLLIRGVSVSRWLNGWLLTVEGNLAVAVKVYCWAPMCCDELMK